MKTQALLLSILGSFCSLVLIAETVPSVKVILDLTQYSSYDSLLIHDSKVWVGIEGFVESDPTGQHRVVSLDINDPSRRLEVRIPHAAQYLYAYGPNQVIAVGLSAYGIPARWRSHYSIITNGASKLSVKTHNFPLPQSGQSSAFPNAIFAKQFGASNGRQFFSLRYGENGIMEFTGMRPRKLKPRITMADQILPVGNSLLVIEKDYVDNVVKIDLRTEQATRLFPKGSQYHITRMLPLGNNRMAMTDWSRVVFVNLATFKVEREVELGSALEGLATFGSCLLVTDSEALQLYVLNSAGAKIDTWDLSTIGSQFENARNVVTDYEKGKIFVRATRFCPYCSHSPNSLALLEEPTGRLKEMCR